MDKLSELSLYIQWVDQEATAQCDHCGAYINKFGMARDHWRPLVRAPWDKGDPIPHLAAFFGFPPVEANPWTN